MDSMDEAPCLYNFHTQILGSKKLWFVSTSLLQHIHYVLLSSLHCYWCSLQIRDFSSYIFVFVILLSENHIIWVSGKIKEFSSFCKHCIRAWLVCWSLQFQWNKNSQFWHQLSKTNSGLPQSNIQRKESKDTEHKSIDSRRTIPERLIQVTWLMKQVNKEAEHINNYNVS